MTRFKLVLIALALCLCLAVAPAMAVSNGYESKYVDTNPAIGLLTSPEHYQGTLLGRLRCADNVMTKEVLITNDAAPGMIPMSLPVNPDGTFETSLIPGNFTLSIDKGNGGQPEHTHFRIARGFVSYPEAEILGHGSTYIEAEDLSLRIISARYYATIGGVGSVDVETILQGRVVEDTLTITGVGADEYDTLFGVPAGGVFGTGRFLDITYTHDRVTVSITYAQDTAFTIP